ncbi:putative F-box protein At5g62660 [Argentina anserina]|uniref:putative F-box protein At5g62660 n=1 Tax=Argentina anserina TaxID=57926 RepID=UPI0021762D97|nr:putative F-box protein At5g62660 [Potentilla anserina]
MERETGRLMELPVDTLVDILLRLPAKSVGCIKCVSKTLLNTVSSMSFSTLHTRLWGDDDGQIPRLMYCTRNKNVLALQSLKYKDNTLTKGRHTITVSSSTPGFVHFVFRNIICLGFCLTGDCVLVNALGERGVLRLPECSFARPDAQKRFSNSWFGMGFDDITSTYKILCVTRKGDAHLRLTATTVHVLVLGTNSWRQISSLPPYEFCWRLDLNIKPVCANGAVHWLAGTQLDRIVSFDFRSEEFCWTPTPPTLQQSWNDDPKMSLFALKGCLAIVRTKRFRSSSSIPNIEIWVLKDFDQEEKLWEMYYKNKMQDCLFPLQANGTSGEWEHGIFCTTNNLWETSIFFLDARFDHWVVCPLGEVKIPDPSSICIEDCYLGTYSHSETLISLRDYADLVI